MKLTRLAELMGKSQPVVSSCFIHHKDSNGRARCFSVENIRLLNHALPLLAEELRDCRMTFGSARTFRNSWGFTYDPALVEPMKRVAFYLNIYPLTKRLLDWSKSKCKNTITSSTCPVYGNIMEADVESINAELLSIADKLEVIEVIPDKDAYDGPGRN